MAKAFIMICAVLFLSCGFTLAQSPTPDCSEMKTRLDRAETKLQDWPALARYREHRHALPGREDSHQPVPHAASGIECIIPMYFRDAWLGILTERRPS